MILPRPITWYVKFWSKSFDFTSINTSSFNFGLWKSEMMGNTKKETQINNRCHKNSNKFQTLAKQWLYWTAHRFDITFTSSSVCWALKSRLNESMRWFSSKYFTCKIKTSDWKNSFPWTDPMLHTFKVKGVSFSAVGIEISAIPLSLNKNLYLCSGSSKVFVNFSISIHLVCSFIKIGELSW